MHFSAIQLACLAVLILLTACSRTSPSPLPGTPGTPVPTPDIGGTVAAQVRATVQAQGSTRTIGTAIAVPQAAVKEMAIVLDELFATPPSGWPDDAEGVAWHEAGRYHIAPPTAGEFVAIGSPITGALSEVVVSATFRKVGGPHGGGFGLIVCDQDSDSRDGREQGGRFVVAEIGDVGTVGVWRREHDHWVDLVPWTPSRDVHTGAEANELIVQASGDELTMIANGSQVARARMGLPGGGVGVFVGGDGNHVILERLTVRSESPNVRARPIPPPSIATPEPAPTSTPEPTAIPPTPTALPATRSDLLNATARAQFRDRLKVAKVEPLNFSELHQVLLGTPVPEGAVPKPGDKVVGYAAIDYDLAGL
jgi:hypothetical protein